MRKFIKRYIPIRMREDLSRTEKVVLCAITYNYENPKSRLTIKEITKIFCLDYRWTRRSIKSLVEKGLCRYMVEGSEKLVSITREVISTIQVGGSTSPLGVNKPSEGQQTPTQRVYTPSTRGSIHPLPEGLQALPPLGIPSNKRIEESSRGGAEAPASTQKGCAGPRSEKEDGKGTDTEAMRKKHSSAEADPRGEFRLMKKGSFGYLESVYHQHYPMTLKEKEDCWEVFSEEVDSWEDYDKCRRCFRTMDARPATLMDYLKEAPWKD
jgi:hypothetical protein